MTESVSGTQPLNWATGVSVLESFNAEHWKTFGFNAATQELIKLQACHLIEIIEHGSREEQVVALRTLRILSREKSFVHTIFNKALVDKLCDFAHLKQSSDPLTAEGAGPALEALKLLCNLVYHDKGYRELAIERGAVKSLIERVATIDQVSPEIQQFDLHMLVSMTAQEPDQRLAARREYRGIERLGQLLARLVEDAAGGNEEILNSTLRVLYNIRTSPGDEELATDDLMHLLRRLLLARKEDRVVVAEVIHNLSNMSKKSLPLLLAPAAGADPPAADPPAATSYNFEAVDVMLGHLDFTLESPHQRERLLPVLVALSQAARSSRVIRKYVKSRVLPPLTNVMNRPEEGDELRNKLVRLMTSPLTEVKLTAADLLFVLCKEKVGRLIKYTGYGNAAGLLATRGLMLGGRGNAHYSSESEDSDTEEYAKYKDSINPVLGCYEEPKPSLLDEMTEEQKEQEAMQLLNLINRLTQCGTIKPCVVFDGQPHPVDTVQELLGRLSEPQSSQEKGD